MKVPHEGQARLLDARVSNDSIEAFGSGRCGLFAISSASLRSRPGIFANSNKTGVAFFMTPDLRCSALCRTASGECDEQQPRSRSLILLIVALEHFPIHGNREMLQIYLLSHVLFGKPVSTFPRHALSAIQGPRPLPPRPVAV